jgi:hypothetical protein
MDHVCKVAAALHGALIPGLQIDTIEQEPTARRLQPKPFAFASPVHCRRDLETLFSYPEPLFQARVHDAIFDLAYSVCLLRCCNCLLTSLLLA